MSLTEIRLERYTAFNKLAMKLSPGINVLVGENATGKTHLMKVAYAACDITKTKVDFAEKLIRVFLPSGRALGRLVKRQKTSSRCSVEVHRGDVKIKCSFSNHTVKADSATITGLAGWNKEPVESVYIPVKEMLSNAPGFRSLIAQREVHFEEVYSDIIDRAYTPARKGPAEKSRLRLLSALQKCIEGKVTFKNQEFFLRNKQGNLEFTLLAEGIRKLGLLWLLIQNGTLLKGSVLFWDEPETNLNPKLYGPLIDILLNLQREGVQVFLATHDYVILKELDLKKKKTDTVAYHALFRDNESNEIKCCTVNDYLDIHPNAIADAFGDLYNREVRRNIGGIVE